MKCVSNLPYSAGTPFVMNLLSSPLPWRTGVFLLQKEVAERLVARPGGKNFGALSIGAALAAETAIEREAPPQCFWPRPNVDSAVVRMEFLPPGERSAIPWKGVRRVAAAVFGSRRKTLKNALKGVFPDRDAGDILAELGIDPGRRGETLTPRDFARLGGLLAF